MSDGDRRRLATFARDLLASGASDGPGPDEVAAYVDGALGGSERDAFEELMAEDPELRAEVAELRELRTALQAEKAARRKRLAAWVGLAAAAIVGVLVWRVRLDAPRPAIVAEARPILALHDGGRDVVLRADGSLSGLPELPSAARDAVAGALRDGRLLLPAELSALAGTRGTLMGGGEPAPFRVVAPVATFVRSDRPVLKWTAHPRAAGYDVEVYDEALAPVASMHVSGATTVTLTKPLARGGTYVWQVAALTPHGRVIAPAPPEPEVRFRVLDASADAALGAALRATGGDDLAAGILLARAGVRDEAEERLARLAADNPGSPQVARLLAAVREAAAPGSR